MKDAVLIKSYQSGITLLMREDASLEEILQELAVKFTEAKNFWYVHHGIIHGGTGGDRSGRNPHSGYHPEEQQCEDRLYRGP